MNILLISLIFHISRITLTILPVTKTHGCIRGMDIGDAMTVIDDTLPNEVFDAYRALFPNERSKAGSQAFPKLVPINT